MSGKQRGVPDVAYNAGVYGGVLVAWYVNTGPGTGPGTWYVFGGTSSGTPQWAGITALADQAAGHRLGLINDDLYAKGAPASLFRDITKGNNIVEGHRRLLGHEGLGPGDRPRHPVGQRRGQPPQRLSRATSTSTGAEGSASDKAQ